MSTTSASHSSFSRRKVEPSVNGARHRNTSGRGGQISSALEAVTLFPALAESRLRLLALVGDDRAATSDVVSVIESDVALLIAVLRLANSEPRGRASVGTALAAYQRVGPEPVAALAAQTKVFDFFEPQSAWGSSPEHFRMHALTTRRIADAIASEVGYEHRDRLSTASLLHDIGKLVLIQAFHGYLSRFQQAAQKPEERIRRERTDLGIDHALMGGLLIQRWGLPKTLAATIERHHESDADGEAALVRLADMLAHHISGECISRGEMQRCARVVGLGAKDLRELMYEMSSFSSTRPRHVDPCPLSSRELRVLRQLAKGSVYKQIAHELGLSDSTVRSHLHNVYLKLGVTDRAQAVLVANARGWLS